ncbi:MAG: type II secretion system protein [Planctomycetota bacterium]
MRNPHGFGLIELLVVIAIIALFLGIGLGSFSYIKGQAEQETAYALVTQTLNAETEYFAQTGNRVFHESDDLALLLNPASPAAAQAVRNAPGSTGLGPVSAMDKSSEVFVWQTLSLPAAADMLRAATGENGLADTDGDGFLELQDPWGNLIEYRRTVNGSDADLPGLIHGAPLLVSAGPDGDFGEYSNANEPNDDARDNVLSFELK